VRIVIVGGGIGGCATALSLHAAGLTDVHVLEAAGEVRELGVGINVLPHAVRELTGDRGVDFAFSAVAAPKALRQAMRMCAYAGTATLVGMPVPGAKFKADLEADFFNPRITLAVTHGGDTIPQEDFPFLAQAALDGRIDLARFVTSTISLDEVPERLPHIGERGEIRTVALL
jgi:S-(hydroxymethyl)mycothiol dehydrogenase